MAKRIITPEFTGSFVNILQPAKPMQGQPAGDPKYTITMLFDKDTDLSALKADAARAATEKWGADQSKWPKNMRSPFRDQGEKEYEGYVAGNICVTASTKDKPETVDENNNPIVESREIYSGARYVASVSAFAYDVNGNKGVSFGLGNVKKVKDGKPLGGKTRASDDFGPAKTPSAGTAADVFG
jgi:hypothetical protein